MMQLDGGRRPAARVERDDVEVASEWDEQVEAPVAMVEGDDGVRDRVAWAKGASAAASSPGLSLI